MRFQTRILSAGLLGSLVLGCGGKPTAPSVTGWFGPKAANVRPYTEITLENGLRVFFVKDDSLPRISLQALVKVGDLQESADMSGLNSLVADLLDQGTADRTANQLSEDFNSLGTEFGASAGSEGTFLSANSLSPESSRLLALFADVLMKPAFNQKEVARTKDQYVAAIKKRVDNPSGFASEEFAEYLFGEHPYGRSSMGTLKSVARIQRTDLIRHYFAYYRPNNTVLAISGRFDPAFEQEVKTVFSKWAKRDIKETPLPSIPTSDSMTLRFVSKPALQQTQIRMGRIGVPRSDPDYMALSLANAALGGGFSSRLMQKIRDDLGLTYGISSSVMAANAGGSFSISTFTKNASVGQAVDEILKVYKDFAAKGITEAELVSAKAQMLGQYPRSIETADQVAGRILSLILNKRPLNELADMPKMIDSLSLSQVNTAIRKHFASPDFKILVYGDQKAIGDQLKAWRPEMISL